MFLFLQKYHFHHQLQGIVVQTYLLHQRFGSQQRPNWVAPTVLDKRADWGHGGAAVKTSLERRGKTWSGATVDGINPATPVDRYFIPLFTGFFDIPGGCLGFLPSTVSSEMSGDPSWSCVRCDKRKKRGPTILKNPTVIGFESLHHDPSTLGVLFFKGSEKSVNSWSEHATNSGSKLPSIKENYSCFLIGVPACFNTSNHGHLRPWLVGLLAAPTWPDSACRSKKNTYKLWCEMFWNLGILTKS